jgi:hypothetical protein
MLLDLTDSGRFMSPAWVFFFIGVCYEFVLILESVWKLPLQARRFNNNAGHGDVNPGFVGAE